MSGMGFDMARIERIRERARANVHLVTDLVFLLAQLDAAREAEAAYSARRALSPQIDGEADNKQAETQPATRQDAAPSPGNPGLTVATASPSSSQSGAEVLHEAVVAGLRRVAQRVDCGRENAGLGCAEAQALCDSHEALHQRVATLAAERDAAEKRLAEVEKERDDCYRLAGDDDGMLPDEPWRARLARAEEALLEARTKLEPLNLDSGPTCAACNTPVHGVDGCWEYGMLCTECLVEAAAETVESIDAYFARGEACAECGHAAGDHIGNSCHGLGTLNMRPRCACGKAAPREGSQ